MAIGNRLRLVVAAPGVNHDHLQWVGLQRGERREAAVERCRAPTGADNNGHRGICRSDLVQAGETSSGLKVHSAERRPWKTRPSAGSDGRCWATGPVAPAV